MRATRCTERPTRCCWGRSRRGGPLRRLSLLPRHHFITLSNKHVRRGIPQLDTTYKNLEGTRQGFFVSG